ncbi:hypothetical protein CLOM_g16716 [Closterium sp. NIES-68]|nr:hypothetical protein CLOM_g16716 [Closterium sp. NIES-68]
MTNNNSSLSNHSKDSNSNNNNNSNSNSNNSNSQAFCRAKLGKKVLWSLEEETSCIKDLWQLPIIPWNGKTPRAATAAAAKATPGGDATAPTDGVLEAVKKVQQQQTHEPAKTPLALVHMDVVGPTRAPSLSGSRYFLTIVDDHTRAVWVYPLKSKGEVAVAVPKEWMPRAQRECGHKVKVIRSDNGGEFIGADFEGELKRKRIQHQLTVPYNPQQNGVAESAEQMLEMQFKCSKMGEVKYYLGMHVERDVEKVGLEYCGVRQRLLRGAADVKSGEMLLSCYTDASFNSVKADGTSIGGYVCLLGGGAVSWRSKKQNELQIGWEQPS